MPAGERLEPRLSTAAKRHFLENSARAGLAASCIAFAVTWLSEYELLTLAFANRTTRWIQAMLTSSYWKAVRGKGRK
jgi:hypothetical protein